MAELSPMMRQYFEIKEKYKDTILFFRLGDFYEMFYDDALIASKELELTLTGRDCGQEERAPMCGVPYHSCEGYIARLIAKGYKVAICEQVEDPAKAKGLVRRDIVRVITPGTVIESSMLDDAKNNYIGSVYLRGGEIGICFADISTGVCHATQLTEGEPDSGVIGELCRFLPSELLFNSEILKHKGITDYIKDHLTCSVELLSEEDYDAAASLERIVKQFGPEYERTTKIARDSVIFYSLAALLAYLEQTQKRGIERLKTVDLYSGSQYMQLSPITRANLELVETMRGREKKGTLLWVLDKTETAMGKRLIRSWIEQPLLDKFAINERLDGTEELQRKNVLRTDLREQLSRVFDLERLMTRVIYGSANPRELLSMASTCAQLPELIRLLGDCESTALRGILAGIDPLQDIRELIESAVDPEAPASLKDGKVIRKGYNPEVDELREIMSGGKGYLTDLETKLRQETGIPKLKIGYNRVFGYYIEVSRSVTTPIPENFVRKQTLANAERYITDELKQLENKILGASERLVVLERELFDGLLGQVAEQLTRVQTTAASLAKLDVLASFAETAVKNGYTRPVVDDGDELIITEGRHPVVERMSSGLFVPNDTKLDCDENRMLIITGPNMAGKSTYMRQNALICLMAQIGSFVPAKAAQVGIVDSIFTRVGASDDLAAGKSTFMVEMTEVAEILKNATPKSLVVLDEIGRGTSTFDGMSIARAVVEHMASKSAGLGCKTLFATHYHELTDLENAIDGVKNYNIAVKKRGDEITFLRRILRGPADDSYGIQVAKLAGLPDEVIERAKEVLKVLESSTTTPNPVMQLDFSNYERFEEEKVPPAVMTRLRAIDVEALTPLEALNILYEIKQQLP
ncbi:MAG TPA: DNA mismatch repair protein MutS [Candidatus Pygmaiobacter gallistercoris]|nr:DNA mismatch repair protein MutS [Candidatus Pygmaiobacter gallistercoris]